MSATTTLVAKSLVLMAGAEVGTRALLGKGLVQEAAGKQWHYMQYAIGAAAAWLLLNYVWSAYTYGDPSYFVIAAATTAALVFGRWRQISAMPPLFAFVR
jgi:hypothetical protein